MTNKPEFNKQHWGEKKIADCIYELNKYNSTLSLIRCKNADYQTSFKIRRRAALEKVISELKVNFDNQTPFSVLPAIAIATTQIKEIARTTQFKPGCVISVKGGKK